jgi:NAD(P)-dependent dehydrogenase (short-subunit alcohol dehydrogenase family)
MKRVLLTGASAGIGRAIAKALTAQGNEVWGTSRNPARLAQLPRLHPVQLDLADRVSIETAFSTALAEAGQFDVVINNAGSGHFGPAESLPPELLAKQFEVLVFGQIRLMQLALASMRGRDEGLIINVSSLASRLPVPFMAAYNSAKAALAMFTMSIQLELGPSRIRLVDLQPSDIRTNFNEGVIRSGADDLHYKESVAKTWTAVEHNMKNAPPPELVAHRVCEILAATDPPPRVTVGDTFQSGLAPFIFRFLPQRLRLWGLRKYYGI